MKKLLVVSAVAVLGLTSVAFAGGLPEEIQPAPVAAASNDTGIYLGINAGWGFTNWNNFPGVTKDNGFMGRVFTGYDINRYFAAELGYSYFFNKPTDSISGDADDTFTGMKTQTIDLMFKGKLPVVDSFDLFAKLGAGWMFSKCNQQIWKSDTASNVNNINVAFGAGADYYITPNIIASAEWLRVNGFPRITTNFKYQPNTDAYMLGIRYKFDL